MPDTSDDKLPIDCGDTKPDPPTMNQKHASLLLSEAALAQALGALRAADPVVVDAMMALAGPVPLRIREPGFAGLAGIVVSQQVSVASARAIFGRIEAQYQGVAAAALHQASDTALKGCGLSAPKIRTLRALAAAELHHGLDFADLARQPAEAARATLTAIHGIGPWTAEIFLLFCAGHPDAWPAGDLALQEGVRLALSLESRPDTKTLDALSVRWRPWRGAAARLIWAYYGAVKRGGAPIVVAG